MREKMKKDRQSVINIGTASMVVILMGLSFAIIAALTLSSAKNDAKLSENYAENTHAYYDAIGDFYETLLDDDALKNYDDGRGNAIIEEKMTDTQSLVVEVEDIYGRKNIKSFKTVNTDEWKADAHLPVLK